MKTYQTIKAEIDNRGVAYLTLNRPELHNAMNSLMWDEGLDAINALDADASVRVVVLTGEGKSFCSGGDLKYQLAQKDGSRKKKVIEAKKLASWLIAMDRLSKPLIGKINGPAYAGGLGLISVCDIAIGLETSVFSITEAKLGLIPAMISPYVLRRIGESKGRRYFLNGRTFSAEEAVRYGLLDRSVSKDDLDSAVEEEIDLCLQCAPGAIHTIKSLISYVSSHPLEDNFMYTVERIADMWDDEEAQEGLKSFVEKTKPSWRSAK